MAELANLQVVVGADVSQAEHGLDSLGQKVNSTGSMITSALGGALVGATVAFGAAMVGSVKSAADFEKQMSAVGSVAGASTSEMEALTKSALQLGKDTSFSAKEAAAGMEELVKAGMSVETVIDGAGRAVLDLAAASGTAVPEAAAIMSNALNIFKDTGLQAADAANILAGASNASATSVHELGYGMAASGNVASMLGFTFEETAAALAMLADAGIKGSDAGTSFKTMMMNLIPTTNKEKDLMRELGLVTSDVGRGLEGAAKMGLQPMTQDMAGLSEAMRIHLGLAADTTKWTAKDRAEWEKLSTSIGLTRNEFFNLDGTVKPLGDVFETLKGALTGMNKEQQLTAIMTIFGTDATRAATIANKLGAEGVTEMTEKMRKQGDVQKIAEERLNNLSGSWEKFTGSVETGAIILGSMALPALKVFVDGATVYVNQAIEIIEQLPDAWRTVGEAFAGAWEPSETLTPFMNMVGQFGTAIGNMYRTVEPFLTDLGVVFTELVRIFTEGGTAGSDSLRAFAEVFGPFAAVVQAQVELTGRSFQGLVIIVQQALTGDIAGAFANFISLIQIQVPAIAETLVMWGQAFVEWIAPMIPPVMAALGEFVSGLLGWLAEQIPQLMAQLALWGAEFVAWVQPQIGPLLSALGLLGAAVLTWVGAQIQPIIAQLLLWGMEFVAWVAPQIPPLLAALGTLYVELWNWIIAQVPGITAQLVKWGLLFGAWVLGVAIPELIKALPGILTTLSEWVGTAAIEIAKLTIAMGVAVATGIVDGFLQAWPTIKGKITEAIGSIQLPSWLGGGGGPGLTSLSNRTGGSSGNALWDQIAREEGVDPGLLASLIQQESGGKQSARSPAGAIGLTQLMPGTAAGLGVDPNDPAQNVRGGARYLRQMLDKFGDEERALIAYNAGPGGGKPAESIAYAQRVLQGRVSVPSAGLGDIKIDQKQWGVGTGMTPQEAAAACGPYAAYLFAQATGRTPNPAEAEQLARAAGWTEAGMGGTANFMKMLGSLGVRAVQQNTSGMSAADITSMAANAGPLTAFSTPGHYFASTGFDPASGKFNVGATGTFAGGSTWMTVAEMAALMGPIQDIIVLGGQMGAAFTTGGKQVTDGLAPITPATTAVASGVTAAFGTMATGVAAQTNLMTSGALVSVTNMGSAIATSVTDSAGTTVATYTDMSGQMIAQAATLANGVSLHLDDMNVKSTTSVNEMAGTITTTMTDVAGNSVVTTTDMAGQVVGLYTTLAADATAQTATMATNVRGSVTDMGEGVLTVTTDSSGQMVAVIKNAAGEVTSQYSAMGAAVVVTASESTEAFGNISEGAKSTTEPIQGVGTALGDIQAPDAGPTVDAFNEMGDAAKNAAKRAKEWLSYLDDINNFDWDEGSGSKKPREKTPSSNTRARGGPVDFGETYLVGERGPELFSPFTSGTIIPNHRLGGGGDTYVVSVNVSGSLLANRRDIEEAVIVGLESAQRRGRI